jgi:hypothetical protein
MLVDNHREIALSMIRFWGSRARSTARGYAQDHLRRSDAAQAQRWSKVGQIIAQIETPASAQPAQEDGGPVLSKLLATRLPQRRYSALAKQFAKMSFWR